MDKISSTVEHSESTWQYTKDLAQAFLDQGLKKPVNGVVQIANQIPGLVLPELVVVEPEHPNLATKTGAILGQAVDAIVISAAISPVVGAAGVAGDTLIGTAVRMGATGAIMSGVLTPTSEKEPEFFTTRLKNAAIGAGSFSAMGAAGYALANTSVFAAEAGSSLLGRVALGASSAVPGGVVQAQMSSLLYKHKLADFGETAQAAADFAKFGAAFGAVGWASSKVDGEIEAARVDRARLVREVHNDDGSVTYEHGVHLRDPFFGKRPWSETKHPDGTIETTKYLKHVDQAREFENDIHSMSNQMWNDDHPTTFTNRNKFLQLRGENMQMANTGFPKGSEIVEYPDHYVEVTLPDGTKMSSRIDVTNIDELQPSMMSDIIKPDGTRIESGRIIVQPDGTKIGHGNYLQSAEEQRFKFKYNDAHLPGEHNLDGRPSYTREILPDGTVNRHFGRGEQITTKPDGTYSHTYEPGKTYTYRPDGSTVMQQPDGYTFERLSDGTKIGTGVTGKTYIERPDGTKIWKDPDGNVVRSKPARADASGYGAK